MAMRIVLRIRTAADEDREPPATARNDHFTMLMTVSSLWIAWDGSVTARTPAGSR